MPTTVDITDQRFGKLVAISPTEERKSKSVVWKFKCDCGNDKLISVRGVRSGTKSCGCLNQEVRSYADPTEVAFTVLHHQYKSNAKKRKLEFELTKEEFRKLTKQNCIYCNVEPKQITKNKARNKERNGEYVYNGVDRVDNDIGYIVENCVPCCGYCNWSKGTRTIEEFNAWVRDVFYVFTSKT